MGMDLIRRRDSIKWTCNNQLWIYILDSAKSSGWKPLGVKHQKNDSNDNDPMDYYSNDNQIVTPEDSENLNVALIKHLEEQKPKGIEKEIVEDFLLWLSRQDEEGEFVDIPGFLIR